ncbi:MAG: DUF354 domain-containing protein [Patescibacteria group bacterium]
MKVLFDILHPAHVHQFKNAIWELQKQGVDIRITARDKDVALKLLDAYGFSYKKISTHKSGMFWLALELIARTLRLLIHVLRERPDVMVAAAGVSIGPVGRLLNIPNLQFYDTESAKLQNLLSYPFATRVFTPRSYQGEIHGRHERYDGYKELGWLAPKYFSPDKGALERAGIDPEERYCVVRFVSFGAAHDVGVKGFVYENKIKLVKALSQYGRVVITSEGDLPPELAQYKLRVDPVDLHSIIAFSDLVVGESSTIASEAVVLGVPAVFVYSFSRGYIDEQEDRYQLVSYYSSEDSSQQEKAIQHAVDIFVDSEAKKLYAQRREQLLSESIDVTEFIIEKIHEYSKK